MQCPTILHDVDKTAVLQNQVEVRAVVSISLDVESCCITLTKPALSGLGKDPARMAANANSGMREASKHQLLLLRQQCKFVNKS